jgi:hypothetical protein
MKKVLMFAVVFVSIGALQASPEDTPGNVSLSGTARAFPSVRVMFDGAKYLQNDADLSGEATGVYDIEMVRRGRFSASFMMKCRTLYGGNGRGPNDPYMIQYVPVDLFHVRYDTGFGYAGFNLDHECNNDIDRSLEIEKRYRWYGTALQFQTYGMRPGDADRNTGARENAGFRFLNSFNFSVYASHRMKTIAYPYRWIFEGELRYDIFRFYHIVPYASASLRLVVDDSVRDARSGEAGARIVLPDVTLTPYAGYRRQYDIDSYRGLSSSFRIFGFRVEKNFTDEPDAVNDISSSAGSSRKGESASGYPAFHFAVGYRRFFGNGDFGYSALSDFRLDLISAKGFTLYGGSGMTHYTMTKYSDLYPRWLEYSARGGAYYMSDTFGQLIDLSYGEVLYRQGDFENPGHPGNRNLELSVRSAGMDPGIEYRRRNGAASYPSLFDLVNWKFSAEKNLRDENTGIKWICSAAFRLDIADFDGNILYALPGYSAVFRDNGVRSNYSCESGVRMFPCAVLRLYLRYESMYRMQSTMNKRDNSVSAGILMER